VISVIQSENVAENCSKLKLSVKEVHSAVVVITCIVNDVLIGAVG